MNSMEHYYSKNNPQEDAPVEKQDAPADKKDAPVENGKLPEKKPNKFPLSFKLKQSFCLAVLGLGFLTTGCVSEQARAVIEAAGLPPEIASHPDIEWYAMNGASPDELRSYAAGIQMGQEADLRGQSTETQEVQQAPIVLEELGDGAYGFFAGYSMEVTSKSFINKMRSLIQETFNKPAAQVFVAVPDDGFGITRIFTDSNIDSYKNFYGEFYAYQGDSIYMTTDLQSLTRLLDSIGVEYDAFGLK